MNDEPLCNCPLCGRTHRKMPFGKPPPVISDTVTIPRAEYEALTAALPQWRGIESAPMKTPVLICNPESGPLPIVAKQYADGWRACTGPVGRHEQPPPLDPAPTYWMPLPPPPASQETST